MDCNCQWSALAPSNSQGSPPQGSFINPMMEVELISEENLGCMRRAPRGNIDPGGARFPRTPMARSKDRFQRLWYFCSARDGAGLSESARLCLVPTPNLAARGERPRLSDIHLGMPLHGRSWIYRGLCNGT